MVFIITTAIRKHPDNGMITTTAGSGAYGSQPGNVTIVAGGNVTGNYLVANGTGAIYAGVKMVNGIPVDANGNPVTDGKIMFWIRVPRAAPGRQTANWR